MIIEELKEGLSWRIIAGDLVEVADYSQLPERPLVSVVMLAYNHAPYISEAIDGVVRQERSFPIELIIGEDCSTDMTREVIGAYAARHPALIRVVMSERNVGAYANLLRLEALVRGKYIAYCEGDDYWHHPKKLQKQISFLEGCADCVLVHSDYDIRDGEVTVAAEKKMRKRAGIQGDVYEEMLRGNYIMTCTVMVRATAIADFSRSLLASKPYKMGDFPRWVYVSRRGKIGYLAESQATYRLSPNSAMRTSNAATLQVYLSSREMQRDAIALYGCTHETRVAIEKYTNSELLALAIAANDRVVFWKEVAAMLRIHPLWMLNWRNFVFTALFVCHAVDPVVRVVRALKRGFHRYIGRNASCHPC